MALNFGAFAGGFATGLSASQQAKRDQERLDLTRQRLGLDIEKRASDQDAALKEATEATRANEEFLGLQSPQGSPARRMQDAPGAEAPQEPDEQAAITASKENARRLSEQKQKSIAKSAGISIVQELGKAGRLPESARPAYFKQVIANSMGLDPNDPKVKEMLGTVSKLTPVDQQEFFGLMTGAAVSAEGDEFTQLSKGFMTQQITIADYMGQLEGIISRSQQNMLADEGKAERPAAPVNLTMPQRGSSLEDEQAAPADQGQTAAGGQGRVVGKRIELSAPDRDILIRTVIGEAGNEPAQGKAAVVGVILNRMNAGGKYGQGLSGVVFAPNQFEPWGTEESSNRLWRISPDSKAYKSAAAIVDAQLEGRVGDQSGGATHFFSPAGQRAMGRRDPRWASEMPETVRIGGHRFFREGDAEQAPPVQTAALATTDARSDAVPEMSNVAPRMGTAAPTEQPVQGTFGERVAQVQPEAASGGLRAATQGSTPAVREEGRKLVDTEAKAGEEGRKERESRGKEAKEREGKHTVERQVEGSLNQIGKKISDINPEEWSQAAGYNRGSDVGFTDDPGRYVAGTFGRMATDVGEELFGTGGSGRNKRAADTRQQLAPASNDLVITYRAIQKQRGIADSQQSNADLEFLRALDGRLLSLSTREEAHAMLNDQVKPIFERLLGREIAPLDPLQEWSKVKVNQTRTKGVR